VFVIVMVIFIWRTTQLHERAVLNDDKQSNSVCSSDEQTATPEACGRRSRTEAHELFDSLMADPTLVTPQKNGILVLPASDYLLAQEIAVASIDDSTRTLLKRLYETTAGKSVQQQVAWWNHSRRFAAIRDDLPQQGNTESRWMGEDAFGGVLAGTDVVPLDFGYVNAGELPTGFNNWLSISGQDQVLFKAEVKLGKQSTLNIQVIGQPDIANLPGKVVLQACRLDSASAKFRCEPTAGIVEDAEVYRVQVTLKSGLHKLQLSVKPASNTEAVVDGLPVRLKHKVTSGETYKNADYEWQPLYDYGRNSQQVVVAAREQFRFKLKMADGTLLFDSLENRPAQFAQDNGLLPLVGYDQGDRLALAGMVSHAKLAQDNTDVLLTLNSDMQRLVHQHLGEELKKVDPDGRYTDERRAAVVLMEPRTGAVLAAANYPTPPQNVNRWDRLSFSKLYPARDPFGVSAWQGLDNNNTPGSVFKMVTALAGLQAAEEGRNDIRRMLRGLDAGEFEAFTGMKLSDSKYRPGTPNDHTSEVSNAEGGSLGLSLPYRDKNGGIVRPPLRAAGCPSSSSVSTNLGLREAVRDSLNIWFSRLGVMLDADNLASGGRETQLVKTANQLGFGKKISLAQVGSPLNPDGKQAQRKGRGNVLSAFTGELTLETQSKGEYATGSALQRLSQNSFGQGVSTTPLQIARVAATVATGELPEPYLLKSWAGAEQVIPDSVKVKPDDIELLREGMKAVPETGTAANAFNKYYREGRCQVYGKTGTAQVGTGKEVGGKEFRQHYNSAWFAGWHTNTNGTPDLAFACMVTHTYAPDHNYGGDVCAPIIARILRDLDKNVNHPGAK
jgi:cell division protein FtsI/penicillin-binding protein 2